MASPLTGEKASVHVDGSNVGNVGKWTVNPNDAIITYQTSGTARAPARAAGNQDWNGNFETYGVVPIVYPGTAFTFEGTMDGDEGAEALSTAAMAISFKIDVDFNEGGLVKQTINFAANGALVVGTLTAAAAAEVAATPITPANMKLAIIAPGAEYSSGTDDRDDILNMSLMVALKESPYSTAGDGQIVKRHMGHPIVTLEFTELLNATDGFTKTYDITSGEFIARFYVDETTFFEIAFVKFDNPDLTVDIESGEPLEQSQTAQYQPIGTDPVTPFTAVTAGFIKKPGGGSFWPT